MRYVVNNNIFETSHDVKIYILDHLRSKYFEKILNEKYGKIEICGKNHWASDILRKLNPLIYQHEKDKFDDKFDNDDGIDNDIENVVENMNEFDTVYLYGFKVVGSPW